MPGGTESPSKFGQKDMTARWQNSNQIYLEACERVRAKKSVENLAERQAKTEAEVERYRNLISEPCCLIHPESKNMQQWDILTMSALFYTATVTPFEVAFLIGHLIFLCLVHFPASCTKMHEMDWMVKLNSNISYSNSMHCKVQNMHGVHMVDFSVHFIRVIRFFSWFRPFSIFQCS